ncbi:hypothetical protein ACXZ65_34570 [Streptomyces aculeolatus]
MGRRLSGTGPRRPETATDFARNLPGPPPRPIADTPVLIGEEEEVFQRCEAAVETLKFAFWAAGKGLQVIRDGRLYRATHGTFDDYVQDRWGMTRAQANKLIRMWPIAEALFESQVQESNDLARTRAKRLSQSVVWELVPVAERYDVDAAQHLYSTTVEASGGEVTAAVLKGAVAALPKEKSFDTTAAAVAVQRAVEQMQTAKRPAPRAGGAAQPTARRGTGVEPVEPPWESPEEMNLLLRRHMSAEGRRMLAKLLAED